jgi:hypothetical protein
LLMAAVSEIVVFLTGISDYKIRPPSVSSLKKFFSYPVRIVKVSQVFNNLPKAALFIPRRLYVFKEVKARQAFTDIYNKCVILK